MDTIIINENEFKGPFNLFSTINCEQCPSDAWFPRGDGYYTHFMLEDRWVRPFVVQKNHNLEVSVINQRVSGGELKQIKNLILYQFWHEYDLLDFYQKFSSDSYMGRLIKVCGGLRVMRDWNLFWRFIEAICTQNASVKQIRAMDRLIRMNFGEKIVFPDGEVFYAFPEPEVLAKLPEKELQEKTKVGYRARFLINAAKIVLNGDLDLAELEHIQTNEAREVLTQIDGVGPKIADIILLYGLGKSDAFPMDIWLKKALSREYFGHERVSENKLRKFALEKFGEHAGIAHLYMFSFERGR